jgi:hypothetical protein
MRALKILFVAIALGGVAIYAQRAWTAPVHGWPAIRVGTRIDAQWIRGRFPVRLISPDWISASGQEELLRRWLHAESIARSALVFVVWLGCLLLAVRWTYRGDTANKTLEPTAAGASDL